MLKRDLVKQPEYQKIIYDSEGPHQGPWVPMRGNYEYVPSVASMVECDFGGTIDTGMSKLSLHRVYMVAFKPGVWDALVVAGTLTPFEAESMRCYIPKESSQGVQGTPIIYPSGKIVYRGHCPAVSVDGAFSYFDDDATVVDHLTKGLTQLEPEDVTLTSAELLMDFPLTHEIVAKYIDLAYLNVYFKSLDGVPHVRTELLIRNLGRKFPFNIGDKKSLKLKVLENLRFYEWYRNVLRKELDLAPVQTISHIGEFKGELRPKLRLRRTK